MKQRPLGLLLFCLAALAWYGFAETQAYFTSQESVEQKVLWLIEKSRNSIDMALFELKSPKLAEALERAKRRGVHVRLILDTSHREQDLPAGEVRWLGGKRANGHGVMHHKFALFDRKRVVTGSFNWTPGAEYANYENALLLDDSKTVNAFAEEFETLWQRAFKGPPPKRNASTYETKYPKKHSSRLRKKSIRIRSSKPVQKRHKGFL